MKELKVTLSNDEFQSLEEMSIIVSYLTKEYGSRIDVEVLARRAIKEYIRIHRVQCNQVPYSDGPIDNRLDELLRKRNIKKGEFAQHVGISSATLSNILTKKNEPTLDVAMRISNALGLHVTDVFFRQTR